MGNQWQDGDFAEAWDRQNLPGNPTRLEQLDILTTIVADLSAEGASVLELGIGSGQVAEMLLTRRPDIHVVGIDFSSPMLAIAQRRLKRWTGQYTLVEADVQSVAWETLPRRPYGAAFSVQALHHLPKEVQRNVAHQVYDALKVGGVFLLEDQIALESRTLDPVYESTWGRLERITPLKSGWSGAYFLQRHREKKEDHHPAPVEEHLSLLRAVGFHAACIHLHLNRALFAAAKG